MTSDMQHYKFTDDSAQKAHTHNLVKMKQYQYPIKTLPQTCKIIISPALHLIQLSAVHLFCNDIYICQKAIHYY